MRARPSTARQGVWLDDAQRRLTMTFSAEASEAARLARVMRARPADLPRGLRLRRGALLAPSRPASPASCWTTCRARGSPGWSTWAGAAASCRCRCYPPDAIALALRAGVPIYATAAALLTPSRRRRRRRARSARGSIACAPTTSRRLARRASSMIVCLCAGVPTSTIQALIERGAACPKTSPPPVAPAAAAARAWTRSANAGPGRPRRRPGPRLA